MKITARNAPKKVPKMQIRDLLGFDFFSGTNGVSRELNK